MKINLLFFLSLLNSVPLIPVESHPRPMHANDRTSAVGVVKIHNLRLLLTRISAQDATAYLLHG